MLRTRLQSTVRLLRQRSLSLGSVRSESTSANLKVTAAEEEWDKAKPFSAIPFAKTNSWVTLLRWISDARKNPQKYARSQEILESMHKENGPIYVLNMPSVRMVSIVDLQAIQQVLRQEGKYPRRMRMSASIELARETNRAFGVFLSEGEEWLRQRRVVNQHMMKIRAVESYIQDFSQVADDFLQRLARVRSPDSLTVAHLDNELFNWALESACTFLLDLRLGCLNDQRDPKAQEFIHAVEQSLWFQVLLMAYPVKVVKWFKRPLWKQALQNSEKMQALSLERIKNRMKEIEANPTPDGQEPSFLEYLICHPDMSKEEIMSNIAEFSSAAISTVSNTFMSVLYELARNPDVQQKLYEEVTQAVPPGSDITASNLQQVPYLKAIIKEAMRLYPVASGIARTLPEDSVILGYQIPKQTTVMAHLYAVGRSESIFPEPETFRPERWLREREAGQAADSRVSTFASLPFGFGPRMCVGRRIAELEMHILLLKLVSRFRVEAVSPLEGPMPLVAKLLLVPEEVPRVRLVDR